MKSAVKSHWMGLLSVLFVNCLSCSFLAVFLAGVNIGYVFNYLRGAAVTLTQPTAVALVPTAENLPSETPGRDRERLRKASPVPTIEIVPIEIPSVDLPIPSPVKPGNISHPEETEISSPLPPTETMAPPIMVWELLPIPSTTPNLRFTDEAIFFQMTLDAIENAPTSTPWPSLTPMPTWTSTSTPTSTPTHTATPEPTATATMISGEPVPAGIWEYFAMSYDGSTSTFIRVEVLPEDGPRGVVSRVGATYGSGINKCEVIFDNIPVRLEDGKKTIRYADNTGSFVGEYREADDFSILISDAYCTGSAFGILQRINE